MSAMSDAPRPQETADPDREGAGGRGGPDGTSPAAARLSALRSGPAGAVPDAVWEDATAQLAGMLAALAALQREVPALAAPPDPPPGAPHAAPETSAHTGDGGR
jgi:hypothetical protein